MLAAPLYREHKIPNKPAKQPDAHKGLWFERFFDRYDNTNWSIGDEAKKEWIETVTNSCGNQKQLEAYIVNQKLLCESMNGQTTIHQNEWHFVTGMGIDHPVENGMSWHPTLGTPYLTGAAVKGLVRAWIEEWAGLEQEEIKEVSLKWFGSESKKPEEQEKDNTAGQFIFFDAIPVNQVRLVCDIMTPHMGGWYSNGDTITEDNYATTLPADWHNPIPIPFLVVKEASLQFCIAPRTKEAEQELSQVIEALQYALEYLGAGAKTATGYGRFIKDDKAEAKLQKKIQEVNRKDMTPEDAFRDMLATIEEKKLAEMFGTKYNKTKEKYVNCNWNKIIKILLKEKKDIIESWKEETKQTAKNKWKAFKNLNNHREK